MRKERRDAVRLKVDGLHTILPYVMPSRAAAEVSMQEVFDITDLNAYMKKRNDAEGTNLKLFHAICRDERHMVGVRAECGFGA